MPRFHAFIVGTLIALLTVPAFAANLHIAPLGSDQDPGTAGRPVATILRALVMAASGDTLVLAEGTYTGTGNEGIVCGDKAVALISAAEDATDCIIEGQAFHGLAFRSAAAGGSLLRGLTIRGFGTGLEVHGARVTVQDCIIEQARGVGVTVTGAANVTLNGCIVSGNESVGVASYEAASVVELIETDVLANGDWGVKSTSDRPVTVRGGRIAENMSGGYYSVSLLGPVIDGCEIAGNLDNGLWIRSLGPAGAHITGCRIHDNHRHGLLYDAVATDRPEASRGEPDLAIIQGCRIHDNAESGIRFGTDRGVDSYLVTDCVIHGNRIAGVIIPAGPRGRFELSGDTIAANPVGVRIGTDGPVSLEHCIIAYNTGPAVDCEADTALEVMCCALYRNLGGDWTGCLAGRGSARGNVRVKPLFVDHLVGDYDLALTSPCRPGRHPDGADCGLIGALGHDTPADSPSPGAPESAGSGRD